MPMGRESIRRHCILSLLLLVFFLTGTVSAKSSKARTVSSKGRKAKVVSAKTKAWRDGALIEKLAGIAVKVGVEPDVIEVTRYAVKRPAHFAIIVEHAAAQDYPFFALIGAAKIARNRNLPKIGVFTQAKCELPIAAIEQVFASADATIADAKGKQDTNKVIGAAKEYAAGYAAAQTAQARQELIAQLTKSIPYFAELPTICSFAFETNLRIERDLQNASSDKVEKFRRAYSAFKGGNVVEGVQMLIALGASPDIVCEFVDQSVSGGLIGRTPFLGDLARSTCRNFTGKVFDAATGLVKGGIGIVEEGVTAAVEFGNSIGCKIYSLIGNGCSSASPPDPATVALNSARAWCSTYGGLKGFLRDDKRTLLACNDGSACQQRAGEPMRCATAAERAARDAQNAALLQADMKNKLPIDLFTIHEEWSPRCPLADSRCLTAITNALDEAGKNIRAHATAEPTSNYWWVSSMKLNNARLAAQKAVREAEFRVLSQKWSKDFTDHWMPRCGVNQKCINHMTLTRNFILTAVSIHHKQKPNDPHSATSSYYAEGETAAREFFRMIDKAFYHAKGDTPAASQVAFWEGKIRQDAATYETILKSVTEEMNKNPAARRVMIQAAYVVSLGRMPTDGDMSYWQPRSENFREIVEAGRNWLYSPNGAADLNAAVTSVLQFYLKRPPTQNEVNNSVGEYRKKKERMIFMDMRGAMPAIYY